MKAIVQHACANEAAYALSEMERLNAEALAALTGQHNVKLRMFPQGLIVAARAAGQRRARRGRRQERRRAQGARFLSGVPRAHRRLVAHLDQGGAGGAGRVGEGT